MPNCRSMFRLAWVVLLVILTLTSTGCGKATGRGWPAQTPRPSHDQVLFDITLEAPTDPTIIRATTLDILEKAELVPGSTVEFWVTTPTGARQVYVFQSTPARSTSRQAVERHRDRELSPAANAVTAIIEGALEVARPNKTALLGAVLLMVKWTPPGLESTLWVVGSDLAQTEDGMNLEVHVPSSATFMKWASERGFAQGIMAGRTVRGVYCDSSRLDLRQPGASAKVGELWRTLWKDHGGAVDVIIVAGPANLRPFAKQRNRGRRKAPLLSRLLRAVRMVLDPERVTLITVAVDPDSLPTPVEGVDEDTYVDGVSGLEPRAYDPANNEVDAQAAADEMLGPEIKSCRADVASAEDRYNKFVPPGICLTGLVVFGCAEFFLAFQLLLNLGTGAIFAVPVALGLTAGFVALFVAMSRTKHRMVAVCLCCVVLLALASLGTLRSEELAQADEDASILHNAAATWVMVICTAAFPIVMELIFGHLVASEEAKRDLAAKKGRLNELVTRHKAAIKYIGEMRETVDRYNKLKKSVRAQALSKFPTYFSTRCSRDAQAASGGPASEVHGTSEASADNNKANPRRAEDPVEAGHTEDTHVD